VTAIGFEEKCDGQVRILLHVVGAAFHGYVVGLGGIDFEGLDRPMA
jgi:hypothetical protein